MRSNRFVRSLACIIAAAAALSFVNAYDVRGEDDPSGSAEATAAVSGQDELTWLRADPDNGDVLVECDGTYHNTNRIVLQYNAPDLADTSGIYYKIFYNDTLIYTSPEGQTTADYRHSDDGAQTVDTRDGACHAPGEYRIVFFDGDTELCGSVCDVTADIMTAADHIRTSGWVFLRWDNTTAIVFATVYDSLDSLDDSLFYFETTYNGELVCTSSSVRSGSTILSSYNVTLPGVPTVEINGREYLPAGKYTITLYYGDGEFQRSSSLPVTLSLAGQMQEPEEPAPTGSDGGDEAAVISTMPTPAETNEVGGTVTPEPTEPAAVTPTYVPSSSAGYTDGNYDPSSGWSGYDTGTLGGSIPVVTPMAAITAAPSEVASPTAVPTTVPTAEEAGGSDRPGVGEFVDRLYTIALQRPADPVGRQDWIDAITLRGATGADAARGFLYSPEFLGRSVSNEEFVRELYLIFFAREADETGLYAWVSCLDGGQTKECVIEGFINSCEWTNLCLRYGIVSGGTGISTLELEPSAGAIDFCTRLYTTCLNRSADEAGLRAWAAQLANQRDTGTSVARGFFFSDEFIDQHTNNGEFVVRLYRTFMGRDPDTEGFNAWVGQLNAGMSREEVFNGFAQSPEFARICASYVIVR